MKGGGSFVSFLNFLITQRKVQDFSFQYFLLYLIFKILNVLIKIQMSFYKKADTIIAQSKTLKSTNCA